MTPRGLTTALLAVLGVYLIGRAITDVGTAVFFLTLESPQEFIQQSNSDQGLLTTVYAFLEIGLAVSVLLLRSRIARALFPGEPEAGAGLSVSDLQTVLYSFLGLYFAIKALAVLGRGVAELSPHDSLSVLWPAYATSMIEAAFGIALFLGARGIAGAWTLARTAGHTR
jgi:hypothetical protein